MPGFCAIVGCAKSNEVAVKIVRELQSRGILIFLCGNVNGRSIIHQLQEEGVQLGYDTFTVPFGIDTISAVYALGLRRPLGAHLRRHGRAATRARSCSTTSTACSPSCSRSARSTTSSTRPRPAPSASASRPSPTRASRRSCPTGVTTYEHVVSMPFDEIPGADDMERTEKLIQRCIEVRGVKVKIAKVPIPVSYGSAFEGERIRKDIMYAEFGGKRLERVRVPAHEAGRRGRGRQDHRQRPRPRRHARRAAPCRSAWSSRSPAARCRPTSSPSSSASSTTSSTAPRASSTSASATSPGRASARAPSTRASASSTSARSSTPASTRCSATSSTRCRCTSPPTRPRSTSCIDEARARPTHERNERIANLTDESVDTFYSCLLCQSFAPNHVCVINPERVGLCGAYNWLDCKASTRSTRRAPTSRSSKGLVIDPVKGELGRRPTSSSTRTPTRRVERVTLYSIMDAPMTSCGCFECHHGARARGQRLHDRQPRGPQHDALRHDLLAPSPARPAAACRRPA